MALHIGCIQQKLLRVSTARKLGRTTLIKQSAGKGLAEFSNVGSQLVAAGTVPKLLAPVTAYKVSDGLKEMSSRLGSNCTHVGHVSETALLLAPKPNRLPATLLDLESIFLAPHEGRAVLEDAEKNRLLSRIVHPVSFTGDDFVSSGLLKSGCHPARRGTDFPSCGRVSQELHPVTHLQPWGMDCAVSGRGVQGQFGVVLCSSVGSVDERNAASDKDDKRKGPSPDQLMRVKDFYVETLPKFFKERQEYRVYSPDIVFENNYFMDHRVYHGLNAYVMQLVKVRVQVHLAYTHIHVSIQSATIQPEEGTVKVHWRLEGLPQLQALKVWKYMPWNYRKSLSQDSVWHEGYSVFTVGSDGLVHKHRVDRVARDEEFQEVAKTSLATRLAILFGLAPRAPAPTTFSFPAKKSSLMRKLCQRGLVSF